MTRTTVVAMSGDAPAVRDATERDAEACAGIYAPYVTDTAISFERDPPLPAEMALRIAAAARTHAWVVLEDEGRVVGYAYGCPYKSRAAYRWSCEVSVYLERGRRRGGGGRALYEALFTRLAERGFRTAVAGMTLPNDASVGCTAPWGSNRSGSTGTSASSTAGGTTSPGSSGRSERPRTHPPIAGERHRRCGATAIRQGRSCGSGPPRTQCRSSPLQRRTLRRPWHRSLRRYRGPRRATRRRKRYRRAAARTWR